MAKSPYYRVLVASSGRDLTDIISTLIYEDCTEQDDLLKFTIGFATLALVDDKDLTPGTRLVFSFGYTGGLSSPQYSATIIGIECNFSSIITIDVQASHDGVAMKKSNAPTLYQGKTSSQIALEIAKEFGLKAKVDATDYAWPSVPTAGKTKYQLLRYLAAHEHAGLFRFYVKGDTLHFTKLNLKKPSRRTFTYGDGNGTVNSFRPKNNDLNKKAQSTRTSVAGIDPMTGLTFKRDATDGHTKEDTKLANYKVDIGAGLFNGDGQEIGRMGMQPGKAVMVPVQNAQAADNVASNEKKNAALDDITATLVVEGDPNVLADEIYTVANVGKTNGGNWYAKKVTHTLSGGSAYITTLELGRNGTEMAPSVGAPKNDDKNTAAGPAKTDAGREIPVVRYDQNSIQKK